MGIDLRRIFLNDASTPSDFMAFAYFEDYTPTSTRAGGVDEDYASGRRRLWSAPGDAVDIPLTFPYVTAEQIAWLTAHRGRVVCFRDPLGLKVFGAYMVIAPGFNAGYRDPDWDANDSATITLASVTFDEAA